MINPFEQTELPMDLSADLSSQDEEGFWIGPKEDMVAHESEVQPVSVSELPLYDVDLIEELAKIPNKMAFKIGEAAELVGVKQFVLRYWETEFEALRPKKSHHNQRMYTRRDVENAMMIKKLLYKDRFSIEGARKALAQLKQQVKKEKPAQELASRLHNSNAEIIERVRELLAQIQKVRAHI